MQKIVDDYTAVSQAVITYPYQKFKWSESHYLKCTHLDSWFRLSAKSDGER